MFSYAPAQHYQIQSTTQSANVAVAALNAARARYPTQPAALVVGEAHDQEFMIPIYEHLANHAPNYNFGSVVIERPNTLHESQKQANKARNWDAPIASAGGMIPFLQTGLAYPGAYGLAYPGTPDANTFPEHTADINYWLWSRRGMNVVNGDHPYAAYGTTFQAREEHIVGAVAAAIRAGQSPVVSIGSLHFDAVVRGLRALGIPVYGVQFNDERPRPPVAVSADMTFHANSRLADEIGLNGALAFQRTAWQPSREQSYWHQFKDYASQQGPRQAARHMNFHM